MNAPMKYVSPKNAGLQASQQGHDICEVRTKEIVRGGTDNAKTNKARFWAAVVRGGAQGFFWGYVFTDLYLSIRRVPAKKHIAI